MRWTKKYHRNKDYKIVKQFALLPIRVGNEYRWFETCYVLKERSYSWGEDLGWINISWTNAETYEMWKHGCQNRCIDKTCMHWMESGFCDLKSAKVDNNGICYSRVGRYGKL